MDSAIENFFEYDGNLKLEFNFSSSAKLTFCFRGVELLAHIQRGNGFSWLTEWLLREEAIEWWVWIGFVPQWELSVWEDC